MGPKLGVFLHVKNAQTGVIKKLAILRLTLNKHKLSNYNYIYNPWMLYIHIGSFCKRMRGNSMGSCLLASSPKKKSPSI
jgi:hypothetical protein